MIFAMFAGMAAGGLLCGILHPSFTGVELMCACSVGVAITAALGSIGEHLIDYFKGTPR